MEMYFLCRAESYRTVKRIGVTGIVGPRDQYDYMITGLVWSQEQYEKRTNVIIGSVSARYQYDYRTCMIKGLYDHRNIVAKDEYEIRTSMIKEPVSIVHMITWPVTGPGWSKYRYDHRTEKSWYWRVSYYVCAQKIPQNLLCLLCSVGCLTAVIWKLKQLYSTLSAAFHLWSTNSMSQVVAEICLWWSSRPPRTWPYFPLKHGLHWLAANHSSCQWNTRQTTALCEAPLQDTACDSECGAQHSERAGATSFRRNNKFETYCGMNSGTRFLISSPNVNKKYHRHFTQNTAR